MADSILQRVNIYLCPECLELVYVCMECEKGFSEKEEIVCVASGHYHKGCYELQDEI